MDNEDILPKFNMYKMTKISHGKFQQTFICEFYDKTGGSHNISFYKLHWSEKTNKSSTL